MRHHLTIILTLLLLSATATSTACGVKDPDWAFLGTVEIPPETACGREGLTAASLMRLAYDGDAFDGLPDPEPLPADVISAAGSVGAFRHVFPCAHTTELAQLDLQRGGYTDLTLETESSRAFVFHGRDPVGIEGRYLRFSCDWVSDLSQDLDPPPPWSVLTAGTSGTFATVPAASDQLNALTEFAAITFRARMVQPTPPLTAYLPREPVFVGIEGEFTTEPFPGDQDPVRSVLPLCATWIEHDVYKRCDRIYLGVSFQLMLDPSNGIFHQSVLIPRPLLSTADDRGVEGYCRRD